eukprot:243873-Heterocapsa_arctica.AAC.1
MSPCAGPQYGFWLGNGNKHNSAKALPGHMRTAFRVELRAIVHVAEHFHGGIVIVADCKEVVNEAYRIFHGGMLSPTERHADLWLRCQQASWARP